MYSLSLQKDFLIRWFARLASVLCFLFVSLPSILSAGVTVSPKLLFLDPSRRSVPIQISNPGDAEVEVWIESRYGIVTSNDSGRAIILDDSSDGRPFSAAGWIKAYPQRFVLNPKEFQVVRLTVAPPAGLSDAEYWARIGVNSKVRRPAASSKTPGTASRGGITIINQIGVPFLFRKGTLATGINVRNLSCTAKPSGISVVMDLARTGNASYWGSTTFHILGQGGKVMSSSTREIVVYKTYHAVVTLDRADLVPGSYTVEVTFVTGQRRDVAPNDLIKAPPVRLTAPLVIE